LLLKLLDLRDVLHWSGDDIRIRGGVSQSPRFSDLLTVMPGQLQANNGCLQVIPPNFSSMPAANS
jgi:hypothetical protein